MSKGHKKFPLARYSVGGVRRDGELTNDNADFFRAGSQYYISAKESFFVFDFPTLQDKEPFRLVSPDCGGSHPFTVRVQSDQDVC